MHSQPERGHPEHSDDPQPESKRNRVLIGAAIAVALVIVVALHLAGVVGGGTH